MSSSNLVTSSWEATGIQLPRRKSKDEGNVKVLCPKCSATRFKTDDPCLSVTFNKSDPQGNKCDVFHCHHCRFSGAVYVNGVPDGIAGLEFANKPTEYVRPTQYNVGEFELDDATLDFFAKRGISQRTLEVFGIGGANFQFNQRVGEEDAIFFPLIKNGELINAQFRNLGGKKDKRYSQIHGCQPIFFGFDNVVMDGYVASDTLYIVEGHMDALSLFEAGYPFVWSVPNGSPYEPEGQPPIKTPKLSYMDDPDAQYVFNRVQKVVLFGDNDHQGRRLMQELATRIGADKCFRVNHPNDCKDASDVLMKYGKAKLVEIITNAKRMPVAGVVRPSQLADELKSLKVNGADEGRRTGFENLDKIFRLGNGKLVVITGVPETGKTRLVSNLMMNAANMHGYKVSMFTPESRPYTTFISKLMQLHTGKPYGQESESEWDEAMSHMDDYVSFNNAATRTLEELTSIWKQQLMAEGTRFGVLDPFNYIPRPVGGNEGDFVLKALTFLADWCVTNQFTLFVVVHPTKIEKNKNGEYPVVGPYNIYGSSHWYNCADVILSIWRSHADKKKPVQLHTMKVKDENQGTSHLCVLMDYDVGTGRYTAHDNNVYAPGKGGTLVLVSDDDDDANFYDDSDESVSSDSYRKESEGVGVATKKVTRRRGASV